MPSRLLAFNTIHMVMKPKFMFPAQMRPWTLFQPPVQCFNLDFNKQLKGSMSGTGLLIFLPDSPFPSLLHLSKTISSVKVKTLKTWLPPFFSSQPYPINRKSCWLCLKNISQFWSCSVTSVATIPSPSHYGLGDVKRFPGGSPSFPFNSFSVYFQ